MINYFYLIIIVIFISCNDSSTASIVSGCTDPEACNYNLEATDDDGSCEFAQENYNCDGECIVDCSDTYSLTGTISYENSDCSGEEIVMEGMCLPIEDLEDPMDGLACFIISLMGDGADVMCNLTPECNYFSFKDILPFSITFNSDFTMFVESGSFCSNPLITNEQDCVLEEDTEWIEEQMINGNWVEENNIITCSLSEEQNDDGMSLPMIFTRTSNTTLLGQEISIDEETGEESCNSMIFTKQE